MCVRVCACGETREEAIDTFCLRRLCMHYIPRSVHNSHILTNKHRSPSKLHSPRRGPEAALATIDISKFNKYHIPRPAMIIMGRRQNDDHAGRTSRRNARRTWQQISTLFQIAPLAYPFLAYQLVPRGHRISKRRFADPPTNHPTILYGFARACGGAWVKGRTRKPPRPLLGCGGGFPSAPLCNLGVC